MNPRPILFSFRRCPYAMRARLAIAVSGQSCELREIVLRDKPAELCHASAKATVPVLIDMNGTVLDESLDIMHWALKHSDPEQWLSPEQGDVNAMTALIAACDDRFKYHLDRYKYPERYDVAALEHRAAGAIYIDQLNSQLERAQHDEQPHLFGSRASLADMAIAPFIRQFAHTDIEWFNAHVGASVRSWLERFERSPLFERIMKKYSVWKSGTAGADFP